MAQSAEVLYKMSLRDGSIVLVHSIKRSADNIAGFTYAEVSGDGKYLYASLYTNHATQPNNFLFDVATGKLAKSWRKNEIVFYRFVKAGELLEVITGMDAALKSNATFVVLSLPEFTEKRRFKLPGYFGGTSMMSFFPLSGGDRFIVASGSQLLEVDYNEGRLVQTIDMPRDQSSTNSLNIFTALLMPGGNKLAVSHGVWSATPQYIRTFDIATRQFSAPLGSSSFEAKRIRRHPTKNIFASTLR